MCGIAGVISLAKDIRRQEVEEVRRMTSVMRHRGPSEQGYFESSQVALGNARLCIIDPTETGKLPMCNLRGDVWIAYNGEVSNFQELKKRYKLAEKYAFRGTTDTEVLLYLYEELGIQFLNELSGMFAFCLVDLRKEKAFLVRDFYGILPLFYMHIGGKIYFASELKAFHEVKGFEAHQQAEALYHYFSLAYIPGKLTPYKQIEEMRGSQYMEVDLVKGKHSLHTYYELPYEQNHDVSEAEAKGRVHELLLDSVRRNMIADVPLGITLSGGIDSSAILALAKELGGSQGIHTFSLKIGESSFDESPYQKIMVDFAKPQHHEITVNPSDVLEVLVKHVAHIDEPSGNGGVIPSFLLAREATKYVDVLLSGEGGDEVFNAYATHGAYQFRKLYRRYSPAFVRKFIHWVAHSLPTNYKKLSLDFKLKRFTEGAELDTPEAHLYWRHVLTEMEKAELMPNHHDYRPTSAFFSDLFYEHAFDDDLNRISLIDIKHFFIDDLMVKNDRTFLGHSVEGRFPFMDRFLVEYVSQLPVNYRIKGFKRRYIQKEAMRGHMPQSILNRTSFGLEMPHSIWFLDELKGFAQQYLTKKKVERTGILRWETVERLWKAHHTGKKDYGRAIWSILIYLIWFDLFIYEGNYKDYLNYNTSQV